MNTYETFASERLIRPGTNPAFEANETESQYREVGRKVGDLLRETPNLYVSLRVTSERAEHFEPNPRKPAPTLNRITLHVVRLDDDHEKEADGLRKIIGRLQRRLHEIETAHV